MKSILSAFILIVMLGMATKPEIQARHTAHGEIACALRPNTA